ncbi:MAG: molecular chaperone DnaJ [Chryseobacterium sp. 36-9]|nr:MAG: molecular chaperone DnaJ [Chryseobacterium sp. 36-9]
MIFDKLIPILFLFIGVCCFSQQDTIQVKSFDDIPKSKLQKDEYGNEYYYDEVQKAKIYKINGEQVIVMDELTLRANPHFNNQLDRNFYFFLNKKLNRVYPLFLDALEQYRAIQKESANMKGAERSRYMKQRQTELAASYEKQLRALTTTEGQVFAKLMSRATGKTVYEIIKELRGGWSAFWWNVKGNIADVSLKTPYDPHKYRDDLFIESLLQSNWNLGYLQPYPGANEYKVNK